MKKLMSILMAASFATVSVGAFAAAHGGAPNESRMQKDDGGEETRCEGRA